MWYEERAAALGGTLAAEKEAATDEAYTRAGTEVTRDGRLVPVLVPDNQGSVPDNPGSAAAVAGAFVSMAVRCH